MSKRSLGVLVVIMIVATACGGADDGQAVATSATAGDGTSTTAPQPESDQGATSDNTATAEAEESSAGSEEFAVFTVGADTFEFTDADVCNTDPDSFLVQFSNGENELMLGTSVVSLIVRVQVDGVKWSNPATSADPEFSGDTITWAGVMTGVGPDVATAEEASIEVHC